MFNTTVDNVKIQAKNLRNALAEKNIDIPHSLSLELLAKQHGVKDWNILSKMLNRKKDNLLPKLGQQIKGIYKKQKFTGKVLRLNDCDTPNGRGYTFRFDQAVDVATSKHFSNLRQQVSIPMGENGVSVDYKGRPDGLLILL